MRLDVFIFSPLAIWKLCLKCSTTGWYLYEPIHTQADKGYLDFECEMECDDDEYDEEDEGYEGNYSS